ncbi:metabotropic glutamate receptor 3 [Aplysia californica]|uniref:Metabotropic glutamate receptor 3 n=1 Tax=Aplysia californica TaxID=6500 RepID=A0ABM0JXP3_APLCA|nr:metabotropic glutamate receptor 3 [Aplysia californica]
MTSSITLKVLRRNFHIVLCCLLCPMPLPVSTFPPEVHDSKFQFFREGDVNIGAVVSFHRVLRQHGAKSAGCMEKEHGQKGKVNTEKGGNVVLKHRHHKENTDTSIDLNFCKDEEVTKQNGEGGDHIKMKDNRIATDLDNAVPNTPGENTSAATNSVESDLHARTQKTESQSGSTNPKSSSYKYPSSQSRRKRRSIDRRVCSDTIQGYQSLEDVAAILFALEQINNRTDILPNITLGVYILDDCSSESMALARSLQFMPAASGALGDAMLKHYSSPQQTAQTSDAKIEKPTATRHQAVHMESKSSDSRVKEGVDEEGLLNLKRSRTRRSIFLSEKRKGKVGKEFVESLKTFQGKVRLRHRRVVEKMSKKNNNVDRIYALKSMPQNKRQAEHKEGLVDDKNSSHDFADPNIAQAEGKSEKSPKYVLKNVTDVCAQRAFDAKKDKGRRRLRRKERLPPFYEVVGVVGAYTSSLSIVVADVMTLFGLPQISHASTVDTLSDKSKFPYFFRTLPPDRYQIRAMAELIRHFSWNFISLVYSADPYGLNAEKSLRSLLAGMETCIAQSIELTDSMGPNDYDRVIDNLRVYRNARVVALYADIKHIQPLMAAVRRKEAYREFIWAGSDTTSLVSDMENENCRYILGSLSVTFFSSTPPDFINYYHDFIKNYIDNQQVSTFKTAYAKGKFEGGGTGEVNTTSNSSDRSRHTVWSGTVEDTDWDKYYPTFAVPYAIDAVYAFAYALHNFVLDNCPGATGSDVKECLRGKSLLPYLKSVRFQGSSGDVCFNDAGDAVGKVAITQCQIRHGEAKQVAIGAWDMKYQKLILDNEQQWPNGSSLIPASVCAEPCPAGDIYTFPKQTCCWKCVSCKPNEITVNDTTRCVECPVLEWPDETKRERCFPIEPTFVNIRDSLPLSLAIVAVLGLGTSTVTAFIFYLYRNERVIRSSSKELSFFMLIGVFVAFLLVFSLLVPPTGLSCYASHVGFSLTFTLVYAPLLVKTNRIYRIFAAGRKTAALPRWTSSSSQLFIALLFILMQVLIVTISTILNPPTVAHCMPVRTEKHVTRYCDMPLSGFLSSLAFNLVLVLVCTWYAFKTRRLPDNYNESRYIAFCVDTTVLIWVSFIPTYFTITRPYYKVFILALALLINSIVCHLCLFVPKLYTLYLTKRKEGSTSRSVEERSELNIQLASNTSFSGIFRSTTGGPLGGYKDKSSTVAHSQTSNQKLGPDGRIHENGGASQEVHLLTLPEDIVIQSETNLSVSSSEQSDSIS